jgi:uncharacterized membrane protein
VAGILASAQMAALVATGGFSLLNWGLFGLIAAAAVWLSTRDPKLERLPPVGLAISLLLLSAWPSSNPQEFGLVFAGTALILGLLPLRRLWSAGGGLLDAVQVAAISLGGWLLPMLQFHRGDAANDVPLGALAAGLGAAMTAVAAWGWRAEQRREDARFAIVSVAAALLASAAASLLLPLSLVGVAIAAAGFALLHVGQAADDPRLERFAWIFAAAGLTALLLPDASFGNVTVTDATRFALMTTLAALFAWRGHEAAGRAAAQFAAPLLLYGALAPVLHTSLEPFVAPVALLALAFAHRRLERDGVLPAMAAAALVIGLWAAWPLIEWTSDAIQSLLADPMLLGSVPDVSSAARRLLLPGLLVAAAVHVAAPRLRRVDRLAGLGLAAVLVAVAVHSLFKQLFAIGSFDEWVSEGFAERIIWELGLLGGAGLAMRLRERRASLALAGIAAAHFAAYTLLLHNPLWTPQHVGQMPVLNLLLPAYGLALALAWAARRYPIADPERTRRVTSIAQMLLITSFAFSSLRQLFHGSLLTGPGLTQAEDIGRSMVAIALAIGFLLWGIARRDRDWRLASLGLMLAAVGKVFLLDASGLEGLTRIASFIALGFSLIGIGWLYARHLPAAARPANAAEA